MAQWIEHGPVNHRITSSIPSQGTCLGCRLGSQLGACERQPHIDVSLPFFLPPFPNNKEIKSFKKTPKLASNESPGLDGFTGAFYLTFREELTPLLLKLFQNIQEKEKLPNLFYEASIILIPKADKDTTKKRKL